MQHTKVVASSVIAVLLALSVAWGASVSVTLNATVSSVSLPNGNYQFVANGLSPDSGFVPANPIIGVFANDITNANQTWTWNGTTLAAVGAPAGTYMKDTGSGIGLVAVGSADTWQIHKVGSTGTYTMFDVTTGRYLGMNGSTSGAPGSLVEGAIQTAWIANASNDLTVASNGHYLNKNGVPFFFFGDTEWILNLRSDGDVTTILNDRVAKGFSVVQVMAVRSWNVNGSGDVSHDANGNLPFVGSDPTQLNAAYWARWHSIASQTATKGLHFLLVYGEPGTGTSNWNCTTGAQCYEYGRQVGVTFRDLSNVIFSNGQDSHASSNTALYRAMAEGIADGVNGVNSFNGSADYSTTMMTYHGQDDQIATLHQDLWLDFYGVEVYGNIASIYNEVNSMYNLVSPTKPGMILEGDYETFTYPDGLATPYRERLQVWNVAFAGGAYSYGHNSNYLPSQAPSTYLNSVGAQGMQVFSTFMRARPWWNLVPHQAAILSGAGSGETQKDAVQSVDGSECLIYYPDVEAVTIGMNCITSSNAVTASWFDPRNGNTQSIGSFANSGSQTFTPPSGWEDAVLVLDSSGTSQPLLGMYQGQGTSPAFHTWAGRYPDYVINLSFLGPGGGSDPSGNSPNPVILDFDTIGTSVCTSFATAASGGCDTLYHNTIDNLVIPYASHVYAIRINSEWTQAGTNQSSPFDGSCNARIDAATWVAGVQHLINVIRSYPALANVKLELDAPQSTAGQAYWPGDSYVELTGFDRYFFSQFDGTSAQSWDLAINQTVPCGTNINTGYNWGQAHGKPLMVAEWCDTYGDGFILANFAAWMKTHNVVAQTYWDSNDAIGSPLGCKLLDQSARQTAYVNAFGGSSYTGTYWTLQAPATGGY